MRTGEAVTHLLQALRALVAQGSVSLSGASRKVGRYPAYFSRALAGRYDLKVEDTFKLLAYLKVDTKDFLTLLFPFGGAGAAALARNPPADYEEDAQLRETVRKQRDRRGELRLTPAQRRGRVASLLKTLLRRKKVSQRAASLALGMGASALGQALRGSSKLTWRHVFGVLDACRVTPGRFVMELFGPDDEDLLAGLRWTWYLDEIEAGFVKMMAQANRKAPRKQAGAGG